MQIKKLSLLEKIDLYLYLGTRQEYEKHSDYYTSSDISKIWIFKGLLERLNAKGITVQRLEDIPSHVSFNPSNVHFAPSYISQRVETAHILKHSLHKKERDIDIDACYFSVDNLVSEE